MEDEARARRAREALRRLVGRLAMLWQDGRSAARRRRSIFRLWDEAAEDESGAEARQAVIDFVRETLPESSADAYTPMELAHLNAERVSAARFAPY